VRVLAVGAHPDDLEILCGGTLSRFASAGHEVTMCHVTRGDAGSFVHSRDQIARIRGEEARRAADVVGAGYATLGLPDGGVSAAAADHRRAMVDLVREARPDVIITHHPGDYMGDHNEVSKLVFHASFVATLPLVETRLPHHSRVTPLYYMETVAGLGFSPVEFVDVTEAIDAKVAMLEAHTSQLQWLRDHDGVDVVDQVRTTARFRGQQCGAEYAEAFAPCLTWLRATTRRLLP
jgi:LmbE family N-acetylglucosaminyl deacetylase